MALLRIILRPKSILNRAVYMVDESVNRIMEKMIHRTSFSSKYRRSERTISIHWHRIRKNIRELKACNVFEPRTATGSVLFFYLTCLYTTKFILSSLSSLVETISLKIWERPLSCCAKCSPPVGVRGSKSLLPIDGG